MVSRCLKIFGRLFYVAGSQFTEAYKQSKVAGSQLFFSSIVYLNKGSLLIGDSILLAVIPPVNSNCEFPGTLEMFFQLRT